MLILKLCLEADSLTELLAEADCEYTAEADSLLSCLLKLIVSMC